MSMLQGHISEVIGNHSFRPEELFPNIYKEEIFADMIVF